MIPHSGLALVICLLAFIRPGVTNVSPAFENFLGTYFVSEDKPIGYVIGTLQATDPDDQVLTFEVVGDVNKQLLQLVETGDKSANIVLNKKLDYEAVDQYTITVQVKDSVNRIERDFYIYVVDVNDNVPFFVNRPYRAEIPEDATKDTLVYTVSASDPDTGISGLIGYSITTKQDMFAIDQISGKVTLNGALDYESEKFYQIGIQAQDGGGLNSTADLIVNVVDVQDTGPFFLNMPYMASIPENITVGTSIMQVSALDGDRGVPNPVSYTFSSGPHTYFNLDTNSGLVTLAKEINREDEDVLKMFGVLELEVQASEVTSSPQGPTTAVAPITVTITDINDQKPTFSQSSYSASVLENSQTRIPITFQPVGTEMSVKDLDQGDNGRFELYLERNGVRFEVFDIVPTRVLNEATVMIRVQNTSALNYEEVNSYTFDIVAKEYMTAEKFETRAQVTVQLEDVNDNWPMFAKDSYTVSIKENPPNGTFVTNITATDKDSGQYGQITYTLRGGSANLFRVDPNTGAVFVNVDADKNHQLIDREKVDIHFLTLEATDGGGLRSSVQLEIKLLDENDNHPVIARSQYEGYVKENAKNLERSVEIQATDIDLTPNNIIQYSIVEGDPFHNITINATNGHLSLTGPMDYEAMDPKTKGVISFNVAATDKGTPPLNSTVPVIIYVEDVNDETPYFAKTSYSAIIAENSPGGTNVSSVSAKDDDGTAPNNEIIYRIESGAKDKFRIDASTGEVIVESGADLDRDLYGEKYTLKVLAIDRGTPPLTGTATLTVEITDINNKVPEFTPASRTTRLSEATPIDTPFFTYSASDPDQNALLKYKLGNDITGEDENRRPFTNTTYLKSLFGIHRDNGTLFVKAALDREIVEEITVTIFAEDLNAEQPKLQNNTAKLTIVLDDVNDNPPEFSPSNHYLARISEASNIGLEVKQVLALDKDENASPVKYYVVYDSEISQSFEITDANRERGLITLKKTVDREKHQWMNFTVEARDAGVPPLAANASVSVELADVNDNSPVWANFDSTVYVAENATLGSAVTTVVATDEDSGDFGNVMYFMTSGGAGLFTINQTTGVVTIAGKLNREKTSEYIVTIEARDNIQAPLNRQRKTSGVMTIKVTDINDYVPQFEQASYRVTDVQESAKQGARVVTVKAIDLDAGANGEVEYSIDVTAGNATTGMFAINPTTGVVSVNQLLQGNIGWYFIKVIAQDKGVPPQQNSTLVYIFIEDVNDHKPQIMHPPVNTTIFIMENSPSGYWVTQVNAKDNDQGINGIVRYEFVENPSNINKDWLRFTINDKDGNITTANTIDREKQEVYFLEIRAYDLGTPSYDDRRTIKIVALDQDDNPPSFDRAKYPPPFKMTVKEENNNIAVGSVSVAEDPDTGNNSVTCYYLVGGDSAYVDNFHLDKDSGLLRLEKSIDREKVPSVNLIVKASEDCRSDHWTRPENTNVKWNYSDTSLLWVEVKIQDINDNPPQFLKKWFTAGVTRDTQFGENVIDLASYAFDPDEKNNSHMYYYIDPPTIRITEPLKTQLRQRGENEPFKLNKDTGIIKTNIYFQQNMQGYFEFRVRVNNTALDHFDTANVSVYLLNEDQRVRVIIRGNPSEVGAFKDHFSQFLSNITGAIINVDMIRTHQDPNGKPDEFKSDMFIHAIDPKTGEVLEARVLIDLIDKNYVHLVDLFKRYNVIEVVPAVEPGTASVLSPLSTDETIILIICIILLFVICIVLFAIVIWLRKKYKRKLKAATAMAFENPANGTIGSRDSALTRNEVPGTNLHSYEGSNPIWLETYANGFAQDDDTDSKNSLDENAIEPAPTTTGFDEQEMSMQMYNDEFDHLNKLPSNSYVDSDIFLKAALNEHDTAKRRKQDRGKLDQVKQNGNGIHSPNIPNNNLKNISNGSSLPTNGSIPSMGHDNIAYEPNDNTKVVDGFITTDI